MITQSRIRNNIRVYYSLWFDIWVTSNQGGKRYTPEHPSKSQLHLVDIGKGGVFPDIPPPSYVP
jgi:hypothetical protein